MTFLSTFGSGIAKTGNFLGVNKFGQGIAGATRVLTGEVGQDINRQNQNSLQIGKLLYAAKQEKDPQKRTRLLQLAQGLGTGTSATEIDPNLNLSNKEILGSAANIGLNILTPGAFKGGAGAVIGKNAALGAGFGLASGLEKNRSTKGLVGSTIGGALTGAALGAGTVAFRGLKNYLTKTTPRFLMDNAVRPALNDLKKSVKYGGDTLGKELLNEGVKGGPQKLLQISDSKLNSLEDELQSVLNSPSLSEARIKRSNISKYLGELRSAKLGTPGMKGDVQRIDSIIKDIPAEMTLQQANQMKRRIYNELRDPAFKIDAKLSTKGATLKKIANALKTEIEKEVGGTVVSDINRKLSIYGRLENSIVDQMARQMRNNGIGLTDAILAAGGIASSPQAFLGAIGFSTLRRNSMGIETYAAQGLNKLGEMGGGKIGQTVSGAVRRGVLNLP